MYNDEIATKFDGFFAPAENPNMIREVERVTESGDSDITVWLPTENSGFKVRTSLKSHGGVPFMIEELLPVENKWHYLLKKVSESLIFMPAEDGELRMENINPNISKTIFDTDREWHITKWSLVVIDGFSNEIKNILETGDRICAVIKWKSNKGSDKILTSETRYGWKSYRDLN